MSGRYEFKRPHRETGTALSLYDFADDYYDIIEADVPLPWKKQEIDIVMDPYAWIKLHVKIVSQHPELRFRYSAGGPGTIHEMLGGGERTEIYKSPGNRYRRVTWSAAIGNDVESFADSVFIAAFDTVDYEILY